MEQHEVAGLTRALSHIRGYFAAITLFEGFANGWLEDFSEPRTAEDVALKYGFDGPAFVAVLEYLVVEGYLRREASDAELYRLTPDGEAAAAVRGWYDLLVGGYGQVVHHLTEVLQAPSANHYRDGGWVASGSARISQYDSIPLIERLLSGIDVGGGLIVDVGCGNGQCLAEICLRFPASRGIGLEPDGEAYRQALAVVQGAGLQARVSVLNVGALEFDPPDRPAVLVFAFVLHEMVGQIGVEDTTSYVRSLRLRFPESDLLVVEVDHDVQNISVMRSPMGLGYYNPYFLIHPLTRQRLLRAAQWESIFTEAGYRLIKKDVADRSVDPTELEVGYLLRPDSSTLSS